MALWEIFWRRIRQVTSCIWYAQSFVPLSEAPEIWLGLWYSKRSEIPSWSRCCSLRRERSTSSQETYCTSHSLISPYKDNILISKYGQPLICDFGISRMLDSSQSNFVSTTHDDCVRGSARWMAQELIASAEAKHTKETDVWAYGMTLYVCFLDHLSQITKITPAFLLIMYRRCWQNNYPIPTSEMRRRSY